MKVREYRRRMRELGEVVMAEGLANHSPRDSPTITTAPSSSSSSSTAAGYQQTITDSTATVTPR